MTSSRSIRPLPPTPPRRNRLVTKLLILAANGIEKTGERSIASLIVHPHAPPTTIRNTYSQNQLCHIHKKATTKNVTKEREICLCANSEKARIEVANQYLNRRKI